ncbi:DUF6252 family protein [Salegentibacter sp. F14]
MMKKLNFIPFLFLLLTLGIFSCSKDDDTNEESDFISATINEENWNGDPEVYLERETDTLTILGSGDEQVVVFKIKFKEEGTYDLSDAQASYYTTIGGDVITSLYKLDPESDSQLTITEYHPESKTIKGNFTLTMLQEYSNPETEINLLNFNNGEFRGTIINRSDL